MHSTESSENYLETILILSKKLPVVRSVDIANELGFKKSSVSIAMKNLREKNQITVTDAGFIYLTDEGRAIAESVQQPAPLHIIDPPYVLQPPAQTKHPHMFWILILPCRFTHFF